MNSHLKYRAYEFLKAEKHATDDELAEFLNKNGSCSKNELNKVLMQLEILGLVNISWAAKEKRRVEIVESAQPEMSTQASPS